LIHDPSLIDRLSALPIETFDGEVYRATRRNLEPTTASTAGGRWSPADGPAVLYTSLERDGALAEISFHWSLFTPQPTKPAVLHKLGIVSNRALKLARSSLEKLGVVEADYAKLNYARTQEIGAAAAFIGCDGLIVPSARWPCDNIIIFTDNMSMEVDIAVLGSEEIDWLQWWAANKPG